MSRGGLPGHGLRREISSDPAMAPASRAHHRTRVPRAAAMTVILAAPRLRALRAPRGSAGAPGGFPRTALRLQRRGLRPPRPRPGPGRLFTVTAGNNGAAGAATSMLAAVQDLRIIAASVTLRLLRPPAVGASPAGSGSEVARPGHEQHEHRDLRRRGQPASPPGRSQMQRALSRSVTAVRCDLARPAAVRHTVLEL